jgi:uncharacterized OB-fold protein
MAALPTPIIDDDSREYWESAHRHELRFQRCDDCATPRFPPRAFCPNCLSTNATWTEASGRGQLFSWVIAHHPVHPALVDKVPYVIALVELEEGIRMVTNLIDCPIESVSVDMPLVLDWQDVSNELSIPQFKPAG